MINKIITYQKCLRCGILIFCILLYSCIYPENSKVRQGNRKYKSENYSDAEKKFDKALRKNPSDFNANFNLANSLIQQGKFALSDSILNTFSDTSLSEKQLADIYFNQGSSMLMHYMQNDSILKAIENDPQSIRNYIIKDSLSNEMNKLLTNSMKSYINTLRIEPEDEEARYNLSYAKCMKSCSPQGCGQNEEKEKMEPSEFAKKVKAMADSLNNELLFTNAFQTMIYGAMKDSTVKSYEKYVQKIKEVVDIDTIR